MRIKATGNYRTAEGQVASPLFKQENHWCLILSDSCELLWTDSRGKPVGPNAEDGQRLAEEI